MNARECDDLHANRRRAKTAPTSRTSFLNSASGATDIGGDSIDVPLEVDPSYPGFDGFYCSSRRDVSGLFGRVHSIAVAYRTQRRSLAALEVRSVKTYGGRNCTAATVKATPSKTAAITRNLFVSARLLRVRQPDPSASSGAFTDAAPVGLDNCSAVRRFQSKTERQKKNERLPRNFSDRRGPAATADRISQTCGHVDHFWGSVRLPFISLFFSSVAVVGVVVVFFFFLSLSLSLRKQDNRKRLGRRKKREKPTTTKATSGETLSRFQNPKRHPPPNFRGN